MDILAFPPFLATSLLWQPRPGAWTITVVCKATFVLLPGESKPERDADPPNDADDHWNDDDRRSLHAASDLVPFKRRADVLLVGHAYAPRMQPVSSLITRLVAAGVDKAIDVHADRVWTQDGHLREGTAFTKMPLRWERAAGGPDTVNPVGVRPDARPDIYGQVPIPNLQPPGFYVGWPTDVIPPIGFGPVAPSWPGRRGMLHWHAASWDHRTWVGRPLPADIDAAFFNAAPPDQQVDEIRGDERIVLENLHAEHARLVTRLPGLAPRATVERAGAAAQALQMRCDTLSIDSDRGVCSLVWRGQVALARQDERVKLVIAAKDHAQDEAAETIAGGMVDVILPFAGGTAVVSAPTHGGTANVQPPPHDGEVAQTLFLSPVAPGGPALPFQEASSPWATAPRLPAEEARPRAENDGTGTVFARLETLGPVLPFAGVERAEPAVPALIGLPAEAEQPERSPAPAPPPMIGPLAMVGGAAGSRREPPAMSSELPAGAPVDPIASAGPPEAESAELSIEEVAAIAAEIAEGRTARADVLRAHDLTERAWSANERRWAKVMEEEASNGSSRSRTAYDQAYVRAVEGFRGPITVPEYTRIVIGLERGRTHQVLDELKIQRAALMRIVRLWTKKVAKDAKLSEEARALLAEMRAS